MLHGVRTIAAACEAYPDVARMVLGIHLEGPFLSECDGYRGAHPREAIRDPDWGFSRSLQAASGQRIVLVTLAPERPGAIEFIRRATAAGVTIALGHTAADGATIREAVEAGARLSTHLGNGIAAALPRHPNPIWHQAALDALFASFIADGHHLDPATLRVLARAKGPGKTILVSDASPLSGLPPGTYGDWAVESVGTIVVAGTPYLAGSNQWLEVGLRNLMAAVSWTLGRRPRHGHDATRPCCSAIPFRDWNPASRRTSFCFSSMSREDSCSSVRASTVSGTSHGEIKSGPLVRSSIKKPAPGWPEASAARVRKATFRTFDQAFSAGSLPLMKSPSSFW